MCLLQKNCISVFILQVNRRLKFEYILPFTNINPSMKVFNFHIGHETTNYREGTHTLSLYNVSKKRLQHFIDHNLIFDHLLKFELMENLLLLENDTNNGVNILNDRHTQCKDERMCKIAKETWLKGNIAASFLQFSNLYDTVDKNFQIKLIKILQGLICHSVEKDGMAVVANITEHVKKFSHEKNEMSVLKALWYALFNSNLYDDNCLADTLLKDLEFKLYLEPLIPCLGASYLKRNEIGSYQHLIETCLTHNLDNTAGILLRSLFNYYYKTGYFSGCSAVYECCIELDIKLTKDQIYKFSLLEKTGVQVKRKPQVIKHPKDLIYKF